MLKFLVLNLIVLSTSLHAFSNLRIASYNIRNFDYDQRSRVPTNKNFLKKQLIELQADLIAVQEIHETLIFKNMIHNTLPNYDVALSKCGGAHGQRLGFVYSKNVFKLDKFHENLDVTHPFGTARSCDDGSRPLAIAQFTNLHNGQKIIAISVHLKSGGASRSIEKRFKQLEIIKKVVKDYQAQGMNNIVIMGDFNTTEYIYNGNVAKRFRNFVNNSSLVDVSEDLKCTAYWWGGKRDSKQYPSKLDHILVSPSLTTSNTKTYSTGHCQRLKCQITHDSQMGISYDEVSDHCAMATDL